MKTDRIQSACPRNKWNGPFGKLLRSQGWVLRENPPRWDAENALIELLCSEYPLETKGSRLAREGRIACNKLTNEQREFYRQAAKAFIVSSEKPPHDSDPADKI